MKPASCLNCGIFKIKGIICHGYTRIFTDKVFKADYLTTHKSLLIWFLHPCSSVAKKRFSVVFSNCVTNGDRLRESSGKFQPSPCQDFPDENELETRGWTMRTNPLDCYRKHTV
jgi:hypothetical protein